MNSNLFTEAHSAEKSSGDSEMLFADEGQAKHQKQKITAAPWRVLIVDDEPEVHQITRLILGNVVFNDRALEFLSAYSGKEALEVLAREDDIAVVLLDVVMETVHAGLDTVKLIREQLKNKLVRIILRTGQPGEAPDSEVILDYDINDYKEKSELTYNKLFTTVIAALRTYQQLYAIEKCRNGLKKIIEATAQYCRCQSKEEFATELLTQIHVLLNLGDNSIYIVGDQSKTETAPSSTTASEGGAFKILAAQGSFSSLSLDDLVTEKNAQDKELNQLIKQTFVTQAKQSSENYTTFYFQSAAIGEHIILVQKEVYLVMEDFKLLEIFINNTLSAFNNMLKQVAGEARQA